MPFNWIFSQPLFFLAWLFAIVVTLTIHEFAHGWVAHLFGDDTAKAAGRLTLNPLVHIDVVGFLLLLVAGFGWAKPVPVNPFNFRRRRLGEALVALAGPAANLVGLIVAFILFKLLSTILGPSNLLINFLFMLVLINVVLMLFNLIPIPPLDGSHILFSVLPNKFANFREKLERNGPWILIIVIILDSVFNLGIFSTAFSWVFNFLARFL